MCGLNRSHPVTYEITWFSRRVLWLDTISSVGLESIVCMCVLLYVVWLCNTYVCFIEPLEDSNRFKILYYIYLHILIEPVCCKKEQKSPNQETVLENRGHLKVLSDTKLILNKDERPPWSFRINLVSFRASRGLLLHKPVSWLGLFCRFIALAYVIQISMFKLLN